MPFSKTTRALVCFAFGAMLPLAMCIGMVGQTESSGDTSQQSVSTTMFAHPDTTRYWVSGQANIIWQAHPAFSAEYSGANSLRNNPEQATSNVTTLFLGYSVKHNTELFLDVESASGGGLSDALGLAGFVNVDVVRNPQLGAKPYLARALIRQVVPLGSETVETERGPLGLAAHLPVRRLEFRVGKLALPDFFDVNPVGSDSHYQFMNWTAVDNGAYDYVADTHGYTVGAVAEYYERNWAFRFAEALMPKVANGLDLVWNLRNARAENLELELHPTLGGRRNTAVRLLSFVNHANMGVYRDAVSNYLHGLTPKPDITAHPFRTTTKYGFGVNLEQQVSKDFRGFARWGWNEGQHESFAYTEVDETVEVGGDLRGSAWAR